MKFKLTFVIATVFLFLVGCAASKYRIENIDQQFSANVTHSTPIAIAKFDAITPSKAIEIGALFGVIGVLVANEAAASDIEVLGINLQNKTMEIIQEEFSKVNINYKANDLMEGTTVEEVSKRFKSIRLWGFRTLKEEEIKEFYQYNSDIDHLIHITSLVREQYSNLIVNTKWMIYDRSGLMIAKIRTQSVDKVSPQFLSDEEYFDEVIKLQKANIREFIKLLSSN